MQKNIIFLPLSTLDYIKINLKQYCINGIYIIYMITILNFYCRNQNTRCCFHCSEWTIQLPWRTSEGIQEKSIWTNQEIEIGNYATSAISCESQQYTNHLIYNLWHQCIKQLLYYPCHSSSFLKILCSYQHTH